MNERPSVKYQGYVDELKAQVTWLSSRSAEYCAQLAEAQEQIELLKGRIEFLEEEKSNDDSQRDS